MATNVATLTAKLTVDSSGVKKGLGQAEREVSGFAGKTQKSLGKFGPMVAAGAAVAGAAVVGFAAKSVSAFADFEKGMNEVFTLMPGMSEKAMGQMEDDVKSFSKEMGIATDDAVPALYQAISAGVPPDNVFDFMETAAMAAVGGATELETAVDGISSAVNAYGVEALSAEEASDLMFTAVKVGKTDFGQLSGAMFQVAPIAAGVGVEFSNVTAALAALTAQGVPTSVAATQIKGAIAEMGREGTIAFDHFKDATGQTFPEFIASGGNLQEAFAAMKGKADDMNTGVGNLFGSIEAGQAALALTSESGGPAFIGAMEEMAGSTGATQTAFETMEGSLSRTWDKIKANVQTALIDVGGKLAPLVEEWSEAFLRVLPGAIDATIGAVEKLVGFIQNFVRGAQGIVDWVKNLPGPIKTLVFAIGTIGTALALLYANPVIAGLALVAGAVAFIGGQAREAEAKVAEFAAILEGLEDTTIETGVVDEIEKIYKTSPKAKRVLDRLGLTFNDLKTGLRRGEDGLRDWLRQLKKNADPTAANIHDLNELEKLFGPLADAYEDVADSSATSHEEMRREAAKTRDEMRTATGEMMHDYEMYGDRQGEILDGAAQGMATYAAATATEAGNIGGTLDANAIDWAAWEAELGTSMEGVQSSFESTSGSIVDIWNGATDEVEITAEEMMTNLKESFDQKQEFDKLFKELGDAGMFGLQQALVDGGPGAVGAIREIANSGTMAWEAELRLNPDNALQNLADNLPMYGHWLRLYGSDLARMLESGWNPFLPIPQPGDAPSNKPPPAAIAGNPPGAPVDDRPRQHGGPVSAFGSYLVGERGPELFQPATSGQIIPTGEFGGGGGGGLTVIVEGNLFGAATAEDLVELIESERRQYRLRGGTMV